MVVRPSTFVLVGSDQIFSDDFWKSIIPYLKIFCNVNCLLMFYCLLH